MKILRPLSILLIFLSLSLISNPTNAQTGSQMLYYFPIIRKNPLPPKRIGPFGGTVVAMVADPTNNGIFYAGSWGNGVFKSLDHGTTWYPTSNGLDNLVIQSLAIDPSNPATIYAGTYYNPAVYSGVYKSVDGGATWHATGQMANNFQGQVISRPIVYTIAVDPKNSSTVYAGTRMANLGTGIYGGGGVFKSVNGGQSWFTDNTNLAADDLYVYELAIDPVNTSRVYAAMHATGPYISTNGGSSWSALSQNNYPDQAGRAIHIDPSNRFQIFYSSWHSSGVYSSPDLGQHWYSTGLSNYHVWQIAQSQINSNNLFASTWQITGGPAAGLLGSYNHGSSWSALDLNNTYYQIAPDPYWGGYVFGGTLDSGVMKSSDNGLSWSPSNIGLSARQVTSIAVSNVAPYTIYAAVYQWGVMKTSDLGASWVNSGSGLPASVTIRALAMDPQNNLVIYATTDDAGTYVTRDGGNSWVAINGNYPAALVTLLDIAPLGKNPPPPDGEDHDIPALSLNATYSKGMTIAVSPRSSSAVLQGTNGKGVIQYDGGTGWLATSLTAGTVSAIAFDRAINGKVLAGLDAAHGGIWMSMDNGATWSQSSSGIAGRSVYSLSQSPVNPLSFFAGTDSGVYVSTDGGAHWALKGLSGVAVTAILAHSAVAGRILAGTQNAAYASEDLGATWGSLDPGLSGIDSESLLADPSDPYFYFLVSSQGGVYRINE